MKLILSKSAIEAATNIIKDKDILDIENRKYIESVNSNLDYIEGKKLIKLLYLIKPFKAYIINLY